MSVCAPCVCTMCVCHVCVCLCECARVYVCVLMNMRVRYHLSARRPTTDENATVSSPSPQRLGAFSLGRVRSALASRLYKNQTTTESNPTEKREPTHTHTARKSDKFVNDARRTRFTERIYVYIYKHGDGC